ncbi:MAG: hypothetical protein KAX37_11360 [Opitutaceae bacterium]|jgi:phosphohistidine phosphatase|nr:hypothetical protein [Opitutaceae bacterium]
MIYLVRHAHAVPAAEDPLRPLSLAGVHECAMLVTFFTKNRLLSPAQVWHSPLSRSRETADRLTAGLNPDAARVEIPGLLGDDDPKILLERINALPPVSEIVLVGHNPHLTRLATLLVRGRTKPAFLEFKKGSVLALERTESRHKRSELPRWAVRWYLPAQLLKPRQATAPGPEA